MLRAKGEKVPGRVEVERATSSKSRKKGRNSWNMLRERDILVVVAVLFCFVLGWDGMGWDGMRGYALIRSTLMLTLQRRSPPFIPCLSHDL